MIDPGEYEFNYLDLMDTILECGEPHSDRTGTGTLSLFGETLGHNMRRGFPILTTKKMSLKLAAVELEWILKGITDVAWLQKRGVNYWNEWATVEQCEKFGRTEGDLGPVYGSMWRRYPIGKTTDDPGARLVSDSFVDQIDQLETDLLESPNSRRLIVNSWHPYFARRVTLPPCHVLFQIKVHADNSLSMLVFQRSADLFLGVPYDFLIYGLLLECLGLATGRPVHSLIFSFGDTHIYNNHFDQCATQLKRAPLPAPRFKYNGKLSSVTQFDASKVELIDYDSYPAIRAPVSV